VATSCTMRAPRVAPSWCPLRGHRIDYILPHGPGSPGVASYFRLGKWRDRVVAQLTAPTPLTAEPVANAPGHRSRPHAPHPRTGREHVGGSRGGGAANRVHDQRDRGARGKLLTRRDRHDPENAAGLVWAPHGRVKLRHVSYSPIQDARKKAPQFGLPDARLPVGHLNCPDRHLPDQSLEGIHRETKPSGSFIDRKNRIIGHLVPRC
jgi:hypothetical protein